MASRDVIVAFDDIVHGAANVYSSAFVDLPLGELETYALQAIVEVLPAQGFVSSATIQLEHSADGRNWVSKNATPEIVLTCGSLATFVGQGVDLALTPAFARVRVRVALAPGGVGIAAKVKVYVRQGPKIGFIPPRLSGCALWLRADRGVTGSPTVSAWADQSGTGDSNRNLTASGSPTLVGQDANYNGQSTITFTKAHPDYFTSSGTWATALAQPATWLFIGHSTLGATAQFIMDGNSGVAGHAVELTATGAIGINAGAWVTSASTPGWASPGALLCEFNGAASNTYFNNFATTIASGNAGTNTCDSMSLGSHSIFFGGGNQWNGSMAEVVAYSRLLSLGEKAVLRAYLMNRYALSIT